MKYKVHDVVQVVEGATGTAKAHAGRAGPVQSVAGKVVTVLLDADSQRAQVAAHVHESALVMLRAQ